MISQLTNIKKVEKAAIRQHNNKIPGHRDDDSSSKKNVMNFGEPSSCSVDTEN